MSSFQVANERTSQRDFGGSINLMRAYAMAEIPAMLQFGAKFRDSRKTNNVDDQTYDPTGVPALTMNQVLGSFANPDYYFGHYTLGPLADLNQIINFTQTSPSSIKLNIDKTRQKDASNYDTSEVVSAGYVMNTMDIGRGHLQAGLRVEGTSASYTGYHVTLD